MKPPASRLALIGLDSSHADQLVRLMASGSAGSVELVALGSTPSTHSHELTDRANALVEEHRRVSGPDVSGYPEIVVGQPAELAEQLRGVVDAVIVADRDGRVHASHAEPFLREGVAVFVDKPFTLSVAEATNLLNIARHTGAVLTSYSPMRWAKEVQRLAAWTRATQGSKIINVSGPVLRKSPFGGPAFYAVHSIEMALEIMGSPVLETSVMESGGATQISIRAEDCMASVGILEPSATQQTPFHLSVAVATDRIDAEVALGPEYLLPGLRIFLDAVDSKVPPLTNIALLDVVEVLETCFGDATM